MGRKKETPNLSGVTIPPVILYAAGLSDGEKIVLGKIDNFHSGPKGCYASLDYLAEAVGIERRRFVRIIKRLKERGLIEAWTDPEKPIYTYRKVVREKLPGMAFACETPTSVKSPLVEGSQPVSNHARNQCQIVHATSVKSCTQPVSNRAPVSGGIRIERARLENQSKDLDKNKEKDFVSVAAQEDDLALKIKTRQGKFFEEMGKIFPPRTKSDRTTLARVAIHLGQLVEAGNYGWIIFDQVVGWARIASGQNVENKRALFMAKVIEQTGYKSQKSLLTRRTA